MRDKVTWIVIADGARAQIFAQKGRMADLEPVLSRNCHAGRQRSQELVSDRPGRTFDSGGQGRHAKEPPTDPHRHAKALLAHEIADLLDRERKRHAYESLVLVAPAQALGDLHRHLDTATRKLVKVEIVKDLTHLSLTELQEHLSRNTISP